MEQDIEALERRKSMPWNDFDIDVPLEVKEREMWSALEDVESIINSHRAGEDRIEAILVCSLSNEVLRTIAVGESNTMLAITINTLRNMLLHSQADGELE